MLPQTSDKTELKNEMPKIANCNFRQALNLCKPSWGITIENVLGLQYKLMRGIFKNNMRHTPSEVAW